MGVTRRPHTRDVFAMTDSMDVAKVVSLFAKDGRVVFGNSQPMVGVDEIRTGTTAFFDTIAGLHHEIVTEWKVGDDTIVELKVTYDRKDGQQVTIPCVTIFHTDAAGKIDDYRVFFDVTPIYA
jgi:ketosteroid isomerase-like protein